MAPEVARALTREDVAGIELAYMMAKYGHRAQVRKELGPGGDPIRYFEHPRRVALILIDELKIIDPVMIKSCLLHDCVEDTEEVTEDCLQIIGGRKLVVMVQLLSKKPKDGYRERLHLHADWRTLCVKSCDRKDNLRHMKEAGVKPPLRYRDALFVHVSDIRLLCVDVM